MPRPTGGGGHGDQRNYTYNGSRPHNLVIHYNYEVPRFSPALNPLVRGVLDGWQISGITTMQSGTRTNFTYTFTGAPTNDLTGSGLNTNPPVARVSLVCDPNLPRGERTFDRQFRTECVRPGGGLDDPFYLGTSSNDEYFQPGFVSHDITLFKNFRMGTRNLQFRAEFYNAFNATQYAAVDTGAVFNYATGEQTDTNFGRITGVRANSNRVVQLALRFTF